MNRKVLVISFFAIVVITAIINFNNFAKRYFINSNEILYSLNLINNEENDLDYEILAGSLFLYQNNDLIATKIHNIDNLIQKLEKNQFLKQRHPLVYEEFLTYKKQFKNKENLIFEYLKYALPLKNALTYLGFSLNNINLKNPSSKYVVSYVSKIFLAKSAVDSSFLSDIDINKLKGVNKSFILNLNIYLKYFPKYQKFLNAVLHSKTKATLHESLNMYMKDLNKDLKIFEILSILMIVFIGVVFIGIIILILKLEKSFEKIKYLAEYDTLTSLPNRNKFNIETKNKKGVFVIINIDRFKNINDYFGFEVGDRLLKFIANSLNEFANKNNAKVYRIGADDFGLFFEKNDIDLLKIKIENFIDEIEDITFEVEDKLSMHINLSGGISNKRPYLETADLAMKSIKQDIKEKVGIFTESLNKQIELNIKKSNEITYAIKNNKIKLVYQPIMDKNKHIVKYEVLSRVLENGELKSIYPYLEVLKENKLYTKLTQIVLENSLKVLTKYKDVNLSINLGMEDILDDDIVEYILNYYVKFSNRVTFEILESEISNYEKFEEFVKHLHSLGFSFAIDDFGSGYSNFERVMKLNIDYLKIDGSIIRNILNNEKSKILLETIIDFAKKSKKITIAEFVENKEIFEFLKQLGVEYFQGYYLGKPKNFLEK